MRIFAILLAGLLWSAPASAQLSMTGMGPASDGPPLSSYVGPGDVAGAAAMVWGSCARAYNNAYANGTNSLCDLVDSSTGLTAICTLRVATTGFVDLVGTYCTGSATPTAACAAAAGGSCKITKIYNQVNPGTYDLVQTAPASMPSIVFADLNGLPTVNCGTAGAALALDTSLFTFVGNYFMSGVYMRTANFTTLMGAIGSGTGASKYIGNTTSTNTMNMTAGTSKTAAATDSAWHGVNATFAVAGSILNVDGTDGATSTSGTNDFSASSSFRICRGGALQYSGRIAEAGLWQGVTASRSAIYSNQHGANGYGAF